MLGERLAAKDVKGVAHLYITSAYNTSGATLRAFSTVDLTDFWTQAWTGCPAAGCTGST